MKRIIALIISCVLLFAFSAGCDNTQDSSSSGNDHEEEVLTDQEFTLSQLSGTDALGRKITAATGRKTKKYVGIYYFLWHGYHTQKIYDTSEILEEYENGIVGNPDNPLWEVNPASSRYNASVSPNGAFHYWDEPLYGYYNSQDEWVARKHLELLSFADVDYLLLDYTNAFIYKKATTTLIETILDMQKEGWNVPLIAFMLPPDADRSAKTYGEVYKEYLSNEAYANAFFTADEETNPSGKPLVTGNLDESVANLDSAWYIPLQWPNPNIPYNDNALPWIDWSVNNVQHNHNGMMCVSIAQHTNGTWSSDPYLYPGKQFFRGRGWVSSNPLDNGADNEKVIEGTNFEFQWNNVFKSEKKVNMVIVTGWNEWIAQKQTKLIAGYHSSLRAVFVDSFNIAYSRDAEMMKGGYGDNYYMQLVRNIRKFKYESVDGGAVTNSRKTVDITKGVSEWSGVSRIYLDAAGEVIERNYKSVDPKIIYKDSSNRNDVVSIKIVNDAEKLYLRVEAKSSVTEHVNGDEEWMNVYISTGANGGWQNYNYIVNRKPETDETTSVQKFSGTTLENAGSAKYLVQGNYIFYEIPLSALGVSSGTEIQIKVTDNISNFMNIDDFFVSGEAAPAGRLNFAYKIA